MSDLTDFLAARLDEIEASAKESAALFIRFEAKPGDWTRLMCDPVMGPFGGQTATRDVVTGIYVGKMSDPARVLREVAAKRAILALADEAEDDQTALWDEVARRPQVSDVTTGERIRRALAAAFSDHPDYEEAWR